MSGNGNGFTPDLWIQELYAAIRAAGKDPKDWKEEQGLKNFSMDEKTARAYIKQILNTAIYNPEDPSEKTDGETGATVTDDEEATREDTKAVVKGELDELKLEKMRREDCIRLEIEEDAFRMRLAVREAVSIALGEVHEKVPNQGLAGFIQYIAGMLFREQRLQEEARE